MTTVYIGTPATRDFSAQYVSSLWQTRIAASAAWVPVVGQAIDLGRNTICKRFLTSGFDYLLMHDNDATWHPDAIQRLVDRALPVVSGIIFKRALPTVPTIGVYAGTSVDGHQMYGFARTINRILDKVEKEGIPEEKNELLYPEQPDDIQEIDGAGAHFMLIRRDVIEAIQYPWYECSTTNGGEDFDFCRKVHKAGFKMYVDYSVFTGHVVGPGVEIGLQQFLLYRDKHAEEPWVM
jgi:GT2 family glycosyltransferase